jgi:AcrR family transcriptional regulator
VDIRKCHYICTEKQKQYKKGNMGFENTRDSILSVADRLFSRFGFHKTSMDEIAKIARKAKGSLYYHFASKEELFREVVSNEFEGMKVALSQVVNDESLNPPEKLKKYLLKRMEILSKAKNYHETLQADFYEHFSFLDELRSDLAEWEKSSLKRIIGEGMEQGLIEKGLNVDVAMDVFMLILKGIEIPFFIQHKYEQYSPHFDDLINILLRGIRK